MAYIPGLPPQLKDPDAKALADYLQRELLAISREMGEQEYVQFQISYAAPVKPREGLLVVADGTTWNPGSGAGAYEYKGGAWVKL